METQTEVLKCDVCSSERDVTREVFYEGEDEVIRVYDLCPACWLKVYRKAVNTLFNEDNMKISNYLLNMTDEVICDTIYSSKLESFTAEIEGVVESRKVIRYGK